MSNKRVVGVVTGTRAEYSLLKSVISEIERDEYLELQLIVTGMHLESKFGLTVKEIELEGHLISARIPILQDDDSTSSVAAAMGKGLVEFTEYFKLARPDLVLVLGDRFEILVATIAAHISRIPVAHIHGGESTQGLLDEGFRHSITKMSQIHFAATDEYRNRIVQLGEHPKTVHLVGGLGAERIAQVEILKKNELEGRLNLKLNSLSFLITFHPVTLEEETSGHQLEELLMALATFKDATLIFTMPNADEGNSVIFERLDNFIKSNTNAHLFSSLGEQLYLSCISCVTLVIGNSSSGITEVPSFKKPTINIGDRQMGRIKSETVIDCEPMKDRIIGAIQYALTNEFQEHIKISKNPYSLQGTTKRIVKIIKSTNLDNILKKKFYDLESK